MLPNVPAVVKVTVRGVGWLTDPMFADPNSPAGGGGIDGEFTARKSDVVAIRPPEEPVIVTVAVPSEAVLLAVSVSTLVPTVGVGSKDAVTPEGSPEAVRLTFPEK